VTLSISPLDAALELVGKVGSGFGGKNGQEMKF